MAFFHWKYIISYMIIWSNRLFQQLGTVKSLIVFWTSGWMGSFSANCKLDSDKLLVEPWKCAYFWCHVLANFISLASQTSSTHLFLIQRLNTYIADLDWLLYFVMMKCCFLPTINIISCAESTNKSLRLGGCEGYTGCPNCYDQVWSR